MADVETLSAVVVGALLATAGGFAATRLEGIISRRERERDAALLFGEILSVLELTTRLADRARQRGEPFGHVTLRLVRATKREIDVYDRNRESLFALRSASLRAEIHALIVRMTMALDGVLDSTTMIAEALGAASRLEAEAPARAEAVQRVETLIDARQTAFEFALETAAGTAPIIALLRPLARHQFDAYEPVVEGF